MRPRRLCDRAHASRQASVQQRRALLWPNFGHLSIHFSDAVTATQVDLVSIGCFTDARNQSSYTCSHAKQYPVVICAQHVAVTLPVQMRERAREQHSSMGAFGIAPRKDGSALSQEGSWDCEVGLVE